MIRRLMPLVAGLAILAPSAALADGSSGDSITFRITAVVQPFCRVFATSGDQPIPVLDGHADLGSVREVCNTAQGYVVSAAFTNLSGGTVSADTDSATVGDGNLATFTSNQPRARTRNWQLSDAQLAADDQPIYMHVTISPL